jgi:hypothetical protein
MLKTIHEKDAETPKTERMKPRRSCSIMKPSQGRSWFTAAARATAMKTAKMKIVSVHVNSAEVVEAGLGN